MMCLCARPLASHPSHVSRHFIDFISCKNISRTYENMLDIDNDEACEKRVFVFVFVFMIPLITNAIFLFPNHSREFE